MAKLNKQADTLTCDMLMGQCRGSPYRQGKAAQPSIAVPQEVTSINAIRQEKSLSSMSREVAMEPAEQQKQEIIFNINPSKHNKAA